MNKRFSTLVAAFAAIATVSYAQIGDKYVHLKTSSTYLTWDKASLADSVTLGSKGTTKADMDSALWKANLVRVNMPGNDSIYTLTNKATQKQLSFSAKLNGADKFGTAIAAGISEFKIKHGTGGYSIIGTTTDGKLVEMSQTTGLLMVDGKTDKAGTTGTAAVFTVEAAEANYDVTKADLAPVLPSFKFDFAGRDGGLFTANELIPVPVGNKFRFQVVGQENSTKGTKKPQYITIDTVMVGTAASVKAASFQLDTTITVTSSAYKGALNEGLQTFTLKMDLGNDSIVMTTDSIVRFNTAGEFEVADHGAGSGVTYLVGYKSFDGSAKLVVDSIQINAPLITISKGTPVKLAGGTGVYSLQFKGTGGNATNNDKYLTGTSGTYAEAASVYVPSTQFYVKENEDGTYSAQARDIVSATVSSGVTTGSNGESLAVVAPAQPFTNQPLYAVDAAKSIYTTVGGDTLVFTKLDVDMANKHIGYKYYTKEEMGYGAVKFNLASKAADDIYLTLVRDSVIAGAKGADKAVELRLMEGADLVTVGGDTIYYGAQALGDTLVRVAYAMEKAYNAEGRFAYEGAVVKLTSSTNGAVNENQKRFFFAENPVGGSYKVVAANENTAKMVTMNISNLTVTYDNPTASVETYFNIEGAEAPVYAKVDAGHYNVVNGSEMLTASAGIAKMLRVGDELKAAADDSDFSLYVDSAYVNRGDDNTEYGYYIYKGAEVKNDTIVGNVLAAKGDFVANNATGDSAIFRGVTVVADTIAYTGDLKDGKQNKYKVRDAKNTSLVGFKVVDGEGYEIVALNTNKSLAVVNGTVIFSNTVAPQVFTLDAAEAPTANEGVEVSEVKVIATEGGVQIVGATGKKVVVSNILGQVVANTVITSDNATIAAPQGVVVVAVEGEEAVKAIVK